MKKRFVRDYFIKEIIIAILPALIGEIGAGTREYLYEKRKEARKLKGIELKEDIEEDSDEEEAETEEEESKDE